MSPPCTDAFKFPSNCGNLAYMKDDANQDSAVERHFMRALEVALADKGLTRKRAEARAGLASGTLSLWMRGKRMPSALRYAEIATKLGLDPGELLNDGWRRATEAGLLDDVEPIPDESKDL